MGDMLSPLPHLSPRIVPQPGVAAPIQRSKCAVAHVRLQLGVPGQGLCPAPYPVVTALVGGLTPPTAFHLPDTTPKPPTSVVVPECSPVLPPSSLTFVGSGMMVALGTSLFLVICRMLSPCTSTHGDLLHRGDIPHHGDLLHHWDISLSEHFIP